MLQNHCQLPAYVKTNLKIRPQDNLYGHASSIWIQNNPRPATWATWDIADTALCDKVEKRLQGILREWLAAEPSTLSDNQLKVVNYYRNLLNREKYKADSLVSVKKIKDQIDAIKDKDEEVAKAKVLATGYLVGSEIFLDLRVGQDPKDSRKNRLFVQTLSGYGGRFLFDDRNSLEDRKAYLKYLKRHHELLAKLNLQYNLPPEQILDTEMTLESFGSPIYKSRDHSLTYNKFGWQKFKQCFKFEWQAFCKELGLKPPATIFVMQPDTLEKVLTYIGQLSLADIKAYLFSKVCSLYGEYLDQSIEKNDFRFFSKYMYGTQESESLAKKSFLSTNQAFADILGRAYIEQYLPAAHKVMVADIAEDLRAAFVIRLQNNAWLSEKSKIVAITKLKNIIINIGYSDCWRNYESATVIPGQPVETALLLNKDDLRLSLDLLNHLPNRYCLGQMTENVQEVNTYASQRSLSIQCKAGCLQIPLFDPQATFIYNLAAIGSLIAHELTHHFDETGQQFDKDGCFKPWMTKEEVRTFRNRQTKLIKLADQYQSTPGYYLCGRQVVEEMIADLGGLEIVLETVKSKIKPGRKRDQALRNAFIGYAYVASSSSTDTYKIQQTRTGIHPPYSFRVNEVVRHCPDFYRVFDVSPTDKLYLKDTDRVVIW